MKIYVFLRNITINIIKKHISVIFNKKIYTMKKIDYKNLNFIENHDNIVWSIDKNAINSLKKLYFIKFIENVSLKNHNYLTNSDFETVSFTYNKDYYNFCIEKSIDLIRRFFNIVRLVKDDKLQKSIKKFDKLVFECPKRYFYTFEHIELLINTYNTLKEFIIKEEK